MTAPDETLTEKLRRLGEVVAEAVEATVPVAHMQRMGETVARLTQRTWEV